jgi:hypothetical protein
VALHGMCAACFEQSACQVAALALQLTAPGCVIFADEEDDPTTPTHHLHNGATGDTDEEPGATAVDTAAGSPDTLGSTLAMRGASAMKQIRAPLEALFKRRGSTTPGSFTQPVHGAEGGSLSAGGGLPAGLDARRSALLATLQGAGGGLPGGKYVVEVDANGGCAVWLHVGGVGRKANTAWKYKPRRDVPSTQRAAPQCAFHSIVSTASVVRLTSSLLCNPTVRFVMPMTSVLCWRGMLNDWADVCAMSRVMSAVAARCIEAHQGAGG